MLVRTDDVVVIGVDRSQAKHRQRFTIAHELGHLLMHPGRSVIVEHLRRPARVNFRDARSGLATDREEIEANQFAAGLLMPRRFLENDYEGMAERFDDDDVPARLARKYQVSEQAMRFRLMNLAFIDPT
jgi:Zn-dependent peptidase ImmA (M78 family)